MSEKREYAVAAYSRFSDMPMWYGVCVVRASDKRITCDEEFSDSEDEGEGGRRHQESFKHKRIRLDDKTAPTDKSLHLTAFIVT